MADDLRQELVQDEVRAPPVHVRLTYVGAMPGLLRGCVVRHGRNLVSAPCIDEPKHTLLPRPNRRPVLLKIATSLRELARPAELAAVRGNAGDGPDLEWIFRLADRVLPVDLPRVTEAL
jgi:hypothetical protein